MEAQQENSGEFNRPQFETGFFTNEKGEPEFRFYGKAYPTVEAAKQELEDGGAYEGTPAGRALDTIDSLVKMAEDREAFAAQPNQSPESRGDFLAAAEAYRVELGNFLAEVTANPSSLLDNPEPEED